MKAMAIPAGQAEALGGVEQALAMAGDLRDAIHDMASTVRAPAWTILESPDPRHDLDRGPWADLRPSEAERLMALVNEAEARAVERCLSVVREELTAAALAFAAEHPEAVPRAPAA
jgi:hypothetical protein